MTESHFDLLLDEDRPSTYRRVLVTNPDQYGSNESVGNRSNRGERKVRLLLGFKYAQRLDNFRLLLRCAKYRHRIHGMFFL